MKTVYRFYTNPTDEVIHKMHNINVFDKYTLYAHTNNKKLAKEFIKSRDMNLFILRKSKMSDEDYAKFANKNSTTALGKHKFLSCIDKFKYKWEEVDIVSTWGEKENLNELVDSGGILDNMTNSEYRFLQDDFIKALKVINYTELYLLYMSEAEDYDISAMEWDHLALFIRLYGHLFAK